MAITIRDEPQAGALASAEAQVAGVASDPRLRGGLWNTRAINAGRAAGPSRSRVAPVIELTAQACRG
jgi:hypothetical protein